MAMLKAAFSLEGISLLMSLETKEQKNKIVMVGSIFGLCTTILAGFYWARVDSIMNAQAIRE